MTHTDLLACPWCGQQPSILEDPSHSSAYEITCDNMECPVKPSVWETQHVYAIDAWNTRARTPDTAPSQSGDLIARAHAECRELEGVINHTTMFEFIDALRAAEAREQKLREALEMVVTDKAPAYHDCTDDGLPECAWCAARRALGGDNE